MFRCCYNARCISGLRRSQLDGIFREQMLLNRGKGRKWKKKTTKKNSDAEKQVAPELCLGSLHQPLHKKQTKPQQVLLSAQAWAPGSWADVCKPHRC